MILESLHRILPAERIKSRLIDVITYASDAGFYQLIPKAVVQPVNEDEVKQLFALSHQQNIPLVFRAGGTSLSGQCITDGILVDLSKCWNKISIENNAAFVRVQPGITGAMVNTYLKKHACKIGPDPSSISAAMMGGILSNNASGMCCGVKYNSYHTAKYIRFILPDGNTYSTEVEADYDRFATNNKTLANELINLRNIVLNNSALSGKIRFKYQTKNTVGYSLNALLDYEHPLDIFAHLLVGAEGTLAFIAEAVMQTIPDLPYKSTALLYFTDIYAACTAIEPLIAAGAEMVELMDRASLRSVENIKGIDLVIKTLPEPVAALLVEFQEKDEVTLNTKVDAFLSLATTLSLLNKPAFTKDAAQREFYWKIRKGLFPAVGAVRASGTTVILEDVAFPLQLLGDAILDLQVLFKQHQYNNAIIFGHAKDGNIHFVVTQAFNAKDEVERYHRFINDVVELVVKKYNGALKAEHGTGRNMAPFVETEWGGEAYAIMKRIKEAADPKNLLNPGVIINADKDAHIKNLKPLPSVEEEVDKCIECGYCEHKCPSRDLTMTPRRRIVARRALQQLKAKGQPAYKQLIKEYEYDGLETCAVDGLCATACPVDINTGDLVKRLRKENHSAAQNKTALWVARHFGFIEKSVRLALQTGKGINSIAGKHSMHRITKMLRKFMPAVPLWSDHLKKPPSLKPLYENSLQSNAEKTIIYFPACISRVLGNGEDGKKSLMETFLSVSAKAGINVIVLKNVTGTCCGQIFSSKGFYPAYQYTANKIVEHLWKDSEQGKYPVVIDVSSCTYTLHHIRAALTKENQQRYDKLVIIDSVDYLHDYILPVQSPVNKKNKVVLHPVCALEKLGIEYKFVNIAKAFANEVTVPVHAGCCGMAGDRGFLFPELTAAATAHEANEVCRHEYDGYYSSTKTCEIAMSEAVKKNYESVLYLVDECI
ncbi:FAD-binding and (Fe-S)-binding domain-containing protein [Parafilimonas terrae]|uniref:D-lactate dehydrogenase (cytochrome) n=1 Tax=Parafilimonas terrae TaxID=1465490 RepID=A0A1I5UD52_9BACT|nr:FAD-binding and (Fe-S)-binding domain-containing protein [Parafilimonas terrae]SFP93183.1 D-lactate dehydrogenase [Parafilimonas terrae]